METIKIQPNQTITGQKHYNIPTKIYLVYAQDDIEYPDGSWVVATFATELEAKKYCELHEQLQDGYAYFYDEKILDTIDLNAVVKPYYSFSFDTRFKTVKQLIENNLIDTEITVPGYIDSMMYKLNHPDNNWINEPDETYNRIYDEDLHIEEQEYGDWKHYTIYSINSHKEARDVGLKLWEEQYEKFKTGAID